jgi:UDPglucose--hexose-1-phosphate uridylyltransferase
MVTLDKPHRRYNPLTAEWVLVSPQRTQRPWRGQVEKPPEEHLPPYDPECYLCPGNARAGGQRNPNYTFTFVFDNDFPALLPPSLLEKPPQKGKLSEAERPELFRVEAGGGICRVVCFSPRHDLTLPELPQAQVEAVVRTWMEQCAELSRISGMQYVQVFENKGQMMGCSNPHPHCQIWASTYIPNEPHKEINAQIEYSQKHGSCLLCDVLAAEQAMGERVVIANEHFTVLVPFWAIWPFEVLLISHRHVASLTDLNSAEVSGLAQIMRRLTIRYDNLFETSFPYSMGFHQAPSDGKSHPHIHLHAHYYPPLLRSATVRKFLVGYEMLAMPQRDLTPESAAERLRSLSEIHYRHGSRKDFT